MEEKDLLGLHQYHDCCWPDDGRSLSISSPDIDLLLGVPHTVLLIDIDIYNTLRPRQNAHHFTDNNFKCIFLNENLSISLRISLEFVLMVPINNIPTLVQIMDWRRPGDKPLSEPMMVSLLMHICHTRPQWVNQFQWDDWDSGECHARELTNDNSIFCWNPSSWKTGTHLYYLYNQQHGCRCPGDTSSLGMSSHGTEPKPCSRVGMHFSKMVGNMPPCTPQE